MLWQEDVAPHDLTVIEQDALAQLALAVLFHKVLVPLILAILE